MSVHKSLRTNEFKKKKRSVLKRTERVQHLLDKNEKIDIYHLPKEKVVKVRAIMKEKKKPEDSVKLTQGAL